MNAIMDKVLGWQKKTFYIQNTMKHQLLLYLIISSLHIRRTFCNLPSTFISTSGSKEMRLIFFPEGQRMDVSFFLPLLLLFSPQCPECEQGEAWQLHPPLFLLEVPSHKPSVSNADEPCQVCRERAQPLLYSSL